eukprot:gene17809-5596_t
MDVDSTNNSIKNVEIEVRCAGEESTFIPGVIETMDDIMLLVRERGWIPANPRHIEIIRKDPTHSLHMTSTFYPQKVCSTIIVRATPPTVRDEVLSEKDSASLAWEYLESHVAMQKIHKTRNRFRRCRRNAEPVPPTGGTFVPPRGSAVPPRGSAVPPNGLGSAERSAAGGTVPARFRGTEAVWRNSAGTPKQQQQQQQQQQRVPGTGTEFPRYRYPGTGRGTAVPVPVPLVWYGTVPVPNRRYRYRTGTILVVPVPYRYQTGGTGTKHWYRYQWG